MRLLKSSAANEEYVSHIHRIYLEFCKHYRPMTVSKVIELPCNFRINTVIFERCFGGLYFIQNTAHGDDLKKIRQVATSITLQLKCRHQKRKERKLFTNEDF
jgi:hypothetical protein